MSPARDGGGGGSSCLKKLIRPTHIKRRGQARNIVSTAPSFPPKKIPKKEGRANWRVSHFWLVGGAKKWCSSCFCCWAKYFFCRRKANCWCSFVLNCAIVSSMREKAKLVLVGQNGNRPFSTAPPTAAADPQNLRQLLSRSPTSNWTGCDFYSFFVNIPCLDLSS